MALLLLAMAAALVDNSAVASHPISITRASVYLTQETADVKIEVFLEDLYLFHNLKPNREDFLERSVIDQGIELHEQFLRDRFEITDVSGQRYEPERVSVGTVELPDEGVPLAELMGHQLVFQLRYVFPSPPEYLTFTQQFTDSEDVLPSETKLAVKQENAGAPYEHTLLPHVPYSVRVSWDNPPLSSEASEQQRQEWEQRQRESLLGITSYSSVYSFLYVGDFEVRHEILAPLLTLDEDLLLARDEDDLLDLAEQDAAAAQIRAYFATGNPVVINGHAVEPVVQRCDFYGLDMKDFAQAGKRRVVPLSNARVGVILSYRTSEPPDEVQLTWDRFNGSLWAVRSVVISDVESKPQNLTRIGGRNVMNWSRPENAEPAPKLAETPARVSKPSIISIPYLSLAAIAAVFVVAAVSAQRQLPSGLLGMIVLALVAIAFWQGPVWKWVWSPAQPPAPSKQTMIFERLHANVYSAFRRRTEESIYDALSLSADGELLERIYLEIRRGLAMEDQGGAVARVRNVERLEVSPVEGSAKADAFTVHCRWNVSGVMEHWGHVHRRVNQYVAEFQVQASDDAWKLVDMRVEQEQQVEAETSLRRFGT